MMRLMGEAGGRINVNMVCYDLCQDYLICIYIRAYDGLSDNVVNDVH